MKPLIISVAKTIDKVGCLQSCFDLEARIAERGHAVHELVIEPLGAGWDSEPQIDHFRSGCAPIEALSRAVQLIEQGTPAVVIHGEDNLRAGYGRLERQRLMAIYGDDYPLTEAYTDLARRFIRYHGGSESQFKQLSEALFDNHLLSYRNSLNDDFHSDLLPRPRWYQPLTDLFRGVDCANPQVDFSGRMLLCSDQLAAELGVVPGQCLEVTGVGLSHLEQDGPDQIDEIARYDHLREAYRLCCEQAGVEFAAEFRAGQALLEAYTCYPVVPMAFLLVSGLVDVLDQMPEFLQQHSITVTGGMNLAKAPWNNPALNALITMHHRLLDGDKTLGMIHGNGGLGYRQGVALLSKMQ